MTTYAVISPNKSIRPVRGRGLDLKAANALAKADSLDFFGAFVVVNQDTLEEVAAWHEGRKHKHSSVVYGVPKETFDPTNKYKALLESA